MASWPRPPSRGCTRPSLPTSFSIDKAKKELAASAFQDGFSATLVYPDSVPQLGKMCLILAQNLKQLNIKLTVKQVNADKWLNDLYAHKNLGIQSITFVPDYPDPVNYPLVLLGSEHAVKNDLNIANYKNPVVDKLLATQEHGDESERAREGDRGDAQDRVGGPAVPAPRLAGHGRRGLEEVRLHRLQRALLQPALGDQDPPRVAA